MIMPVAGVAQLVRAPDCGSGCRRFDSGHSPQKNILFVIPLFFYLKIYFI
jgi:hypothetical protein